MKNKQAGGKRHNAGRPKGEPKKAIGKRVPIKWHKHIIKVVDAEIERLEALDSLPKITKK